MCQKSIDIITNRPADVTCGLCASYNFCPLPQAIERRRQTSVTDRQIAGRLSDSNYRRTLTADTGHTKPRRARTSTG